MYEPELQNRTPLLFALSTCPRCQRVKAFLAEHHVAARIIEVDRLTREERIAQLTWLSTYNPAISMPTLIVGDAVAAGEDYQKITQVLGLHVSEQTGASGISGVILP
jgi:glutaredoxin